MQKQVKTCTIKGQAMTIPTLVSMRTIKEGEELTVYKHEIPESNVDTTHHPKGQKGGKGKGKGKGKGAKSR